MKIRDLYIEVRARTDAAVKSLTDLDKLSKRVQAEFGKAGASAKKFGADVVGGSRKAAAAVTEVGKASKSTGALLGGLGGLARNAFAAVAAGAMSAAQSAIDFESAMADIAKVLPALKTVPGEFDKMKESIFSLSKEIAIAPEGFAKIIAAAGQAGIAREELQDFARDSAKVAVAFDITADKAGSAMAKMRTGLGMSQKEVMSLAGTFNHLGQNMAVAAPELVDITSRVGAMAASAGLGAKQTAALGATMVAAGAKTNVAATGIKNFALTMAAGDAATLRQRIGFEKLGLSAEDMAKRFTAGGAATEGAIIEILSKIKTLDKDKQAATVMQLFGKESIGAIAPLLTQLDTLKTSFSLANDEAAAGVSVQNEYAARAVTTANAIQLLKNNIEVAAIKTGDALLPAMNDLLSLMASPEADAMGQKITDGIGNAATETAAKLKEMMAVAGPLIANVAGVFQGLVSGISGGAEKVWASVGPLWEKLVELTQKVLSALGLAGDEGEEFGEQIGEGMGDVAVKAIDTIIATLDGLIAVVTALHSEVRPFADFLKNVLYAAFSSVGDIIDFAKLRVEGLLSVFREIAEGNFGEAFLKFGKFLLDGLVEPIRIVARMLIDLADAVPGGSSLVPQALRSFAGKTAMAGVGGRLAKIQEAVGKKVSADSAAAEAAAEATPMMASRGSMQSKPAPAAPAAEEPAAGGGGGRGRGKRGKAKTQRDALDDAIEMVTDPQVVGVLEGDLADQEYIRRGIKGERKAARQKKKDRKNANLLDRAVMDSSGGTGSMVLGGSDRSTASVGPSVSNTYITFNMDIDARGNEGAAANVDRAGRRAGSRMAGSLRGVDQAAMRARAGGGSAAGAG